MSTNPTDHLPEAIDHLGEAETLLTDLLIEISGRSMEPGAELDAEPIVRQLKQLHLTLEHVQTARTSTRVTRGDFGEGAA